MLTACQRTAGRGTTSAIEARGLVKVYGEHRALDGIDLTIRRGQVFGFLGPNGAGKTTTIRILATLTRPDGGTARVLGHDVLTEADAIRARVAVTGQFASLDEDLTGYENLLILGRLHGLSRAASQAARRRPARRVRPDPLGRPSGGRLLGRHAPPARHRRQPDRDPRPAVPRRADHRAGPAQPQPGVGAGPPDRRGRYHGAAHHPVPRGGRPARRADRGHRQRPDRGRRHQRPAQVPGRLRHPARPAPRRRAASAGAADPGRRPGGTVQLAADPLALSVLLATRPEPTDVGRLVGRAATQLADAGVGIADLSLGQPSLDEAFLALTGHRAGPAATDHEDANA